MTGRRDVKPRGHGIAKVASSTLVCVFSLGLGACSGRQSALDPAGRGASQIADLFWWMVAGSLVIWLAVVWLTYSAIRGRVSEHTERQARLYVIGGGALFPTIVLAALLVYGLRMMPDLIAPA